MADELKEHVVRKIGAIARAIRYLHADLPMTLRQDDPPSAPRLAEGKALGVSTTLADPASSPLKDDYADEEG